MDTAPPEYPSYPMLDFLVRYGGIVAIVVGLCPVLGGLAAWFSGMSAFILLIGLAGGAFAYLIMRSYVELVRVIVDMLLPK